MKILLGIALALILRLSLTAADEKGVPGSFEGLLRTGVFAVGGETTGVVLTTRNGEQYELDLGKNPDLRKRAEALNGKAVVVVGECRIVEGIEVKQRRIIVVTKLDAAA
jgi:hypothetical protein